MYFPSASVFVVFYSYVCMYTFHNYCVTLVITYTFVSISMNTCIKSPSTDAHHQWQMLTTQTQGSEHLMRFPFITLWWWWNRLSPTVVGSTKFNELVFPPQAFTGRFPFNAQLITTLWWRYTHTQTHTDEHHVRALRFDFQRNIWIYRHVWWYPANSFRE